MTEVNNQDFGLDREAKYRYDTEKSIERIADVMKLLGGTLHREKETERWYVFKHTMIVFEIAGQTVCITAVVYCGVNESCRDPKTLVSREITNAYTSNRLERLVHDIKALDLWIQHHFREGEDTVAFFNNIAIPALDGMFRLRFESLMLPVFQVSGNRAVASAFESFREDDARIVLADLSMSGDDVKNAYKLVFNKGDYNIIHVNTGFVEMRFAFQSVLYHMAKPRIENA